MRVVFFCVIQDLLQSGVVFFDRRRAGLFQRFVAVALQKALGKGQQKKFFVGQLIEMAFQRCQVSRDVVQFYVALDAGYFHRVAHWSGYI